MRPFVAFAAVLLLAGCDPFAFLDPPKRPFVDDRPDAAPRDAGRDGGDLRDGGAEAGAPDGGDPDAGADGGPDLPDAGVPDAGPADPIVEKDDPSATWGCGSPDSCIGDYERFLTLAAPWQKPISDQDIDDALWAIQLGQVPLEKGPLTTGQLQGRLIDGLNMRFLVEGLPTRSLVVTTTARKSTADYDEQDLLFDDPLVGRFKGILLVPHGKGPFPVVVAIHGHPDSAEVYLGSYHGNEFPKHGMAILAITLRAMAIDASEHQITHDLLRGGFDLVAMRVYETLVARRYARHRTDLDPGRVGLIGHSGGSSASNLTVRIEPGFRAFVSDNQVDWYRSDPFESYHCETAPLIYPLHALVNDFSTSAVPVKQVPYGYANGMQEIWDFFGTNL
jgi:hypothetical protein